MRTSTRRAVTVSAGTLVLCLSGAGAAVAATIPTPGLDAAPTVVDCSVPPSPDQLAGCATDAVTGVVATVEKTAGLGSGSGDGSAKPAHPSSPAHRIGTHSISQVHAPSSSATSTVALPRAMPALALPAMTGSMAVSALTPAVAGAPARVQLQSAMAPASALDKGAPANALRVVLIALAAASAGALAASHMGIARLSLGRIASSGS
jgi:hypothetical protein